MRTPTTPVISAPVRKVMNLGARLARSYAGETTFAAMFTDTVATSTVIGAKSSPKVLSGWAARATGSQMGSPWTTSHEGTGEAVLGALGPSPGTAGRGDRVWGVGSGTGGRSVRS